MRERTQDVLVFAGGGEKSDSGPKTFNICSFENSLVDTKQACEPRS